MSQFSMLETLTLDELGRTCLPDELLEQIESHQNIISAGTGTNPACNNTQNGACENWSCGGSSNTSCSNTVSCGSTSNSRCFDDGLQPK
jgi:hypothetical protein